MEKPGIKKQWHIHNSVVLGYPIFKQQTYSSIIQATTQFCEGSVALRQKNDESEYPNGGNM